MQEKMMGSEDCVLQYDHTYYQLIKHSPAESHF